VRQRRSAGTAAALKRSASSLATNSHSFSARSPTGAFLTHTAAEILKAILERDFHHEEEN